MERILKNNDVAANALINLHLAWAPTQGWYGVNCGRVLYKKLSHSANGDNIKNKLIDSVLLPEQDHRCCYCMRKISNHSDGASIEHIVPQSVVSILDLNSYFSGRSDGLNGGNVCLTPDYVRRGSVGAPYPHHVAYHNFAIACQDCNNYRGSEKIEPLFLFPNIRHEVDYNKNTGEARWRYDPVYTTPNPMLPTLDIVGVNRPLLKAIRSVWFYAKRSGVTPSHNNRANMINGALGDSLAAQPSMSRDELVAFLSLDTDEMWNEFLKYNYFG